MTDQEIVHEVTLKFPYQMYQLISILDQDHPDLIDEAKVFFAKRLKAMYLDSFEKVLLPKQAENLLEAVIEWEDENETEDEEIKRRLTRVRHEAYVEEHELEYILNAIESKTIDKTLSRDLDYEFIWFHHKECGLDFPTDPIQIVQVFQAWLQT